MLPRPRFGDDAALSHATRQQRLSNGVVDLVRARMTEVFTLHPHRCADAGTEPRRKRQRGGASYIFTEQGIQLRLKRRIVT